MAFDKKKLGGRQAHRRAYQSNKQDAGSANRALHDDRTRRFYFSFRKDAC